MTGKEAIGAIGVGLIFGTGIGGAVAYHSEDVAARSAIVTSTCMGLYDNKDGTLSQQTIDCLEDGWVPPYNPVNINSINSDEVQPGDPAGLLEGYVRLEQYDGTHFDSDDPIVWSVVTGGGVGWALLISISTRWPSPPRPTPIPPKSPETLPEDEVQEEEKPAMLFDQDKQDDAEEPELDAVPLAG